MRMATYRGFGPAAEVLTVEEGEAQSPAPGEVSVAIACSGVNPSDVKARAGSRAGLTALPWPYIVPHSDGAGTITAVGDGVSPARIGQRVWIWNGQWRRQSGTCAQNITLPAEQAVELPEGVSFEVGATMGIPGLTAAHCVLGNGPVEGQTLLIHGGAGTVGYLAVQFAKWAGARVITTARGAGADRARAAGADVVLDYSAPDLAQQILAANDGAPIPYIVDVEFGVNAATNGEVIADCGRIVAYGSHKDMTPTLPFYPMLMKAITLEVALVYLLTPEQRSRALENVTAILSEGKLDVPIGKTFALADIAKAHETVEQADRIGTVLVDPNA